MVPPPGLTRVLSVCVYVCIEGEGGREGVGGGF